VHALVLNGARLPSGVYRCVVRAGGAQKAETLILTK
jgi:hypothetical protein